MGAIPSGAQFDSLRKMLNMVEEGIVATAGKFPTNAASLANMFVEDGADDDDKQGSDEDDEDDAEEGNDDDGEFGRESSSIAVTPSAANANSNSTSNLDVPYKV